MRDFLLGIALLTAAIWSAACGAEPPVPAEPAVAEAAPDAAQLVERLQSKLLAQPRAFRLVASTGEAVSATGELWIAAADPETPQFLLVWHQDPPRRISSDGVTVYADGPDGAVLTSRWESAGTVLFGREAGGLVPAVLNASSFASYGGEVTASGSGDGFELRTPLPTGGEWRLELLADGLPLRISLRAAADSETETLELEPLDREIPTDADEYRLEPAAGGESTEFYAGPAPGDGAPDVTFELADGSRVALTDLRGSVVVLDFWATWCVPCRPAMRELEELHREHAVRGLKVYGLRLWDSGDPAAFLDSVGVTYPTGDGAPFAEPLAIGAYGLPTLYVIGRDGAIADLAVGFKPGISERKVRDAILRALDG